MKQMKIPFENIVKYEFSGIAKALKPTIFKDGDSFCCLLGADPQNGVMGCGPSPKDAVEDWDQNLKTHLKDAPEKDPVVIYAKKVLLSISEVIPQHVQEFYDQFYPLKKKH